MALRSRTNALFRRALPVMIGLLLLLTATAAWAQPADGLTPEQVAMMRAVGEAEISPDGQHVAYTVLVPRNPTEENGPAWEELHVLDLESQESRPFITGHASVGSIAWTPDGTAISFLAKRDGDEYTSLYTIPADGGEAQRIVAFDRAIAGYDWHPEGTQVALLAPEDAPDPANELPYQPIIYEERLQDRIVWIADLNTAAAPRPLGLDGTAYAVHWSPDGTRLAIAAAPTPLVDDRYMLQRVHVVDASTGEVTARIENPGKLGMMTWSPDGQHLALVSAADINDPLEGRLMVVPASGGTLTDVLPDVEGHVEQIVWDDAETIRFGASQGVESVYGTVRHDGSDATMRLEAEAMDIGRFSVADDRARTVFVASTPAHPNEVYVLEAAAPTPIRVTNVNPWLDDVALGRQEVLTYETRDGEYTIEGMLIYPLDYQEGQRYPLILVVHGGPESHYDNGWLTSYSMPGQMAAARGFAVFYPNYRGSTGRGVAFSKSSQADPAGKEFDDLVDGVDHLIERGLADADRVGVTGGSYGGYATGWLSTRYTDRFAAGVMFVGISNKISKVGTTDIPDEEYYVHARKRPWDDWQFFLERSPIYYAGQSETPLLIMHGQDDPRVDAGQSHELYRHLKMHGQAPVRLVLYPGEGHGNRNSAARYDYSLRALRWMEHYLQGDGGEMPPPQLTAEPAFEMAGMQ